MRIVQDRQRIHVFAGSMAPVPAPDPTQFGSLVGMGVEKAQAARGGGCPAAFAALGPTLATPIKILGGQMQVRDRPDRDELCRLPGVRPTWEWALCYRPR